MERPLRKSRSGLVVVSIVAAVSLPMTMAITGEPAQKPKPSPDLARGIQALTDAVLEHHINPPARQQMILSGIKALYQAAGAPLPPGLARRVSAIATADQLAALLTELWPKTTARSPGRDGETETLEDAMVEGVFRAIPGGGRLLSAQERKVAEQFEGNRYVGLHIALSTDETEHRPTMHQVFPGGPADRAGVKEGDVLEAVDGRDTKGKKLREIVEWLRGEEGTAVTIKVRQPIVKEAKSRTYTVTRGRLPQPTIDDGRQPQPGRPFEKLGIALPEAIEYIRIQDIGASTPHELRKRAQQLEARGNVRALVLDLRGVGGSSVHPAVLLADCLLEDGPIGRVRTNRGETTYQADADALFRGWPLAVLVDSNTWGTAEWLAAALQDNHRATIVGSPTDGASSILSFAPTATPYEEATGVRSRVAVAVGDGDGSWSVELLTGTLERGDGRPLTLTAAAAAATASDGDLLPYLAVRAFARRHATGEHTKYALGVTPDLEHPDLNTAFLGMMQLRSRSSAIPKASKSSGDPRKSTYEQLKVLIKKFGESPSKATDEPLNAAIDWLEKALKKTQPAVGTPLK